MLVHFSLGPDLNQREKTVAINPTEVASVVKRDKSNDWALITMRNGQEFTVIGTVERVMDKLNKAETTASLMAQVLGAEK